MGVCGWMWRGGVWLVAIWLVGLTSLSMAWAGERASVTVFEVGAGDEVDAELRRTLSGLLLQEAQQHQRYSLADSAAVDRDELALIAGCDAQEEACLREMAPFVDGDVLVLGDVERRGDWMSLEVEVLDLREEQGSVTLRRIFEVGGDEVVRFRRQAQAVFDGLLAEDLSQLVVESPEAGLEIYVEGFWVGTEKARLSGLGAGEYGVEIRDGRDVIAGQEVVIEEGREVVFRPTGEADEEAVAEGPSDDEHAMEVEDRRVVPGEGRAALAIEDKGYRSNMGAFSLMGIGMGALAASGVMVGLMRSVESELNEEAQAGTLTPQRHRDLQRRGESYEAAQFVLLGVGVLGVGTGVTWAIVNHRRSEPGRASVVPDVVGDGAGVMVRGRW